MLRVNRRRFLEESLLAAAAAAAVEPLGQVMAGEAPSKSPNEKLSVAVIGVRGRGGAHIEAFASRSDCQVTHVCDADRDVCSRVAESQAKKGRKVKAVEDMRRVFDDKSVDIVAVATPNHWHSLAAIWAMQAGKDVYVEKPVSHNVSEGRRMVQVARKYGRICQGGTQYRSVGANRATAQFLREGKLGKITLARCVMHRSRRSIGPAGKYEAPASVDYNLWAGPAPMDPITRKSFHYDWHWFWNYGNGELGNNCIHAVDTMRLLLGLQGLGRGVMSYGGRLLFNDAAETPNTQVTIHDLGDITVVQEVRNLKTAAPRLGATVLVTGSEVYLACTLGGDTVYDLQGKRVQKIEGPNENHFENFLKAVRSRRREDQNAEIVEGHQSTALVHLGNISQRLGRLAAPAEILKQLQSLKVHENVADSFEQIRRHLADNGADIEKTRLTLGPWLTIDSAKETFVGNPAADRLLTRPYRKPFVVPPADAI